MRNPCSYSNGLHNRIASPLKLAGAKRSSAQNFLYPGNYRTFGLIPEPRLSNLIPAAKGFSRLARICKPDFFRLATLSLFKSLAKAAVIFKKERTDEDEQMLCV
jgi:hypothetical protein